MKNEAASSCLLDNSHYDWSITIAFYAALYYIDDAIFPLTITLNKKPIRYVDFEDFLQKYKGMDRHVSIHRARITAIQKVQGAGRVRTLFEKMLDLSMEARYTHSTFEKTDADKAQLSLQEIKKHCEAIKARNLQAAE
jgi:hypothetical protein